MNELQKSIDSWEGKDIAQSCNKFILGSDLLSSPRELDQHKYYSQDLIYGFLLSTCFWILSQYLNFNCAYEMI